MKIQAQAATFTPSFDHGVAAPVEGGVSLSSVVARLVAWLRDDPEEARVAYLAAATSHMDLELRARAWDEHRARVSLLPFSG